MAGKQTPPTITSDAMKAALAARLESEKLARQEYTKTVALAKIKRDALIADAWKQYIEDITPGEAKDAE